MLNNTIKRTVIGFLIGMPVGTFICIIISSFSPGGAIMFPDLLLAKAGSPAAALAMQTLLSGVLGAVAWAGMSFYELESWGMLKAIIVHYATIMASFIIIGTNLGWIAFTAENIGFMSAIMGAAYFVIWLVFYLKYRAEVRELNKDLSSLQRSGN